MYLYPYVVVHFGKMKVNLKISFFVSIILVTLSCRDFEQAENKEQLTAMDFGKLKGQNDSLGLAMELSEFKSFRDLLIRTEEIACKDSLPKITLKTDKIIKTIYFQNPCWERYLCILIKQKNTIKIHNDSIGKYYDNLYPLDSLTSILRREIENNGENPMLSDRPDKILIYISYDSTGLDNLPKTLDRLTEVYSKITDSTNINIWLHERIKTPPPPPPPQNGPEDIEEIEF